MLQGDGDYDGAGALIAEMGSRRPAAAGRTGPCQPAGIPVDIVFEQGLQALGME